MVRGLSPGVSCLLSSNLAIIPYIHILEHYHLQLYCIHIQKHSQKTISTVCWNCFLQIALNNVVSPLYFELPSLFRYTSPLTLGSSEVSKWQHEKPPTANSHLTIDEASDHSELSECSQPVFLPTASATLSFNGRDGGCVSVNSGGTAVLCEARRGPFSPVVNKEVMQRVASPFSHSSSPLHPHLSPHCG